MSFFLFWPYLTFFTCLVPLPNVSLLAHPHIGTNDWLMIDSVAPLLPIAIYVNSRSFSNLITRTSDQISCSVGKLRLVSAILSTVCVCVCCVCMCVCVAHQHNHLKQWDYFLSFAIDSLKNRWNTQILPLFVVDPDIYIYFFKYSTAEVCDTQLRLCCDIFTAVSQ